jgi:hypothetical protein
MTFVIAAVISALAIAPVLLTDHLVKAADTSVGKTLRCDSSKHTKNYCDGFTIGKTDCRDGHKTFFEEFLKTPIHSFISKFKTVLFTKSFFVDA